MRLFKHKDIDAQFVKLGFKKVKEDNFVVRYERYNLKYKYVQVIAILHKLSGRHIVQSYDKDLQDSAGIGNTCVGLTAHEMQLCIQKMKQLGWKITKD